MFKVLIISIFIVFLTTNPTRVVALTEDLSKESSGAKEALQVSKNGIDIVKSPSDELVSLISKNTISGSLDNTGLRNGIETGDGPNVVVECPSNSILVSQQDILDGIASQNATFIADVTGATYCLIENVNVSVRHTDPMYYTHEKAITIAAENVTIDLGGHILNVLDDPMFRQSTYAIFSENNNSVTVKNGYIFSSDVGISIGGSYSFVGEQITAGHLVHDVSIDALDIGIRFALSDEVIVRDSIIESRSGIYSGSNRNFTAEDNTIVCYLPAEYPAHGSGPTFGISILGNSGANINKYSKGNNISNCVVGIRIVDSSQVSVEDNIIENGFYIELPPDFDPTATTTPYIGGTMVYVVSSELVDIKNNEITGQINLSPDLYKGDLILVEYSEDVVLEKNKLKNSKYGISVYDLDGPNSAIFSNSFCNVTHYFVSQGVVGLSPQSIPVFDNVDVCSTRVPPVNSLPR